MQWLAIESGNVTVVGVGDAATAGGGVGQRIVQEEPTVYAALRLN